MNEKMNVFVIGSEFTQAQLDRIRAVTDRYGHILRHFPDLDSAAEQIGDANIIFTGGSDKTAALARRAPGLRWFASHSAGVDPLVRDGALPEDVIITNGSGGYGISISEHLIMVTLMLLRRYPEYAAITARRAFDNWLPIRSIYGARVTVCGTGDIGTCYAERLRAFGAKQIIGVNRTGRDNPAFDRVIRADGLDEVLPETDILALMLPGTRQTDDFITAQRLALLPMGAYLLNVGRGNAVDEAALIAALQSGRLAGAALDVFRHEPLPQDDPLWEAGNLIITPHCSGKLNLPATVEILVNSFCDNLENYFTGKPMKHVIDRRLGY